jgi:hypothetical protein
MSVNQKKSNVIDKIKLYITMANTDVDLNNFEKYLSVDNDPLNFLLLIYKTVEGENQLEALTEYMLTKIIRQEYLDKLQNKLYDSILKKMPENISVPNQYVNPGISMPLKSFDLTDDFKNQATSTGINPNQLYSDIKNNVLSTANQDFNINLVGVNASVLMNYNETKNEIVVRLPAINAKDLFLALTVYIGPLFSSRIIINEIINLLFHTNFKKEDAQIITMVRSYANYESKDAFKMDLNKLLDLELDTEKKGLNVDASCFRENITVTQQQIDVVAKDPTVSNFKFLVPEYTVNSSNSTTNFTNDYLKNILLAIRDALLAMILKQPIVVFLINLFNKIVNVGFEFKNGIPPLIENIKEFLKEIWDSIYEDFLCILLDFIKKILLRIVILVTIKLIKEQLKKRQEIMTSLTGGRFASNLKDKIIGL